MDGHSNNAQLSNAITPPRPPNKWILYRAVKSKDLPPLGLGEPRRSQADVSAMVSEMWKNESAEVRAHYEQMAEEAKQEHERKYPGYQYRPRKKEDKKREKKEQMEAKRAARSCRGQQDRETVPITYAVQQSTSSAGAPYHVPWRPNYYPPAQLGRRAPSLPLSLASSLSDSTGTPTSSNSPNIFPNPKNNSLPTLLPPVMVSSIATPALSPLSGNDELWSSNIPSASAQETYWASNDHDDDHHIEFGDVLDLNLVNNFGSENYLSGAFNDLNNGFNTDVYRLGEDDLSIFLNQSQNQIDVSIGTHPILTERQHYNDYPSNEHTPNDSFSFHSNTLLNDRYPERFNDLFTASHYTSSQSIQAAKLYTIPAEFVENFDFQVVRSNLTMSNTTSPSVV